MPLDVAAMIRMFETGEMPEKEEVKEPETSSLSIIESENVAKKTISSALQKPEEPKETPKSKAYTDLARSLKIKGDVGLEYSPELIAQQLKDKTYAAKEEPTPVESALGAYATFGVALTKIPRAVAASVLQALQGEGETGASVTDRDWADRYIKNASEDIQQFAKEAYMRFGDRGFAGIKITDLAELPQNVGYSATSMLGGLAVGIPLGLVPIPGFRPAAWATGTIASGKVAYNITKYQIMQQYLEIKDKESRVYTGEGLTKPEEARLKKGFSELAHKYGLWEAIPEALSNLAFVGLLTAPLTKMVGKSIAGQVISKLGAMYGEELLTETITQMGQAGIEVRAGMRVGEAPDWSSPTDWVRAFKEIAPQTFLLTTLMAGAGTTVIGTAKAIKDIKKSLRNEIGKTHVHYEGFIKKLDETKKPKVGPQYGEVPPPVTDKKVFLKTAEDVSTLDRLDKEEKAIIPEPSKPYSATLYRGIQKAGPVDEGMYGKGTYYSPVREIAAGYTADFGEGVGELIEKKVTLKNPLRVNYAEIHAFGDAALLDTGNMEAYNKMILSAQRDFRSNAIRTLAERRGHDGILVTDYKGNVKEVVVFGRETALMIPEYPAKIVTAGKRPGVMRTKAQAKKVIHNEKINVLIGSMEESGKVPSDIGVQIEKERGFVQNMLRKLSKGAKIYWAGNRLVENIAGYLDRTRPYGANWKIITGDINDAVDTELDGIYSRLEGLQGYLRETYGQKKMTIASTRERPIGKFFLTDANIMAVSLGSFDPQVVKHLKEGNGFTDKDIEQCVAIVENSATMKAGVDWIRARYEEDYPSLAKVHMEETGEALPKRPFYMHIPVDFKKPLFEKHNIAQQMIQRDRMGTHAYVAKNITKPRKFSNRPINLDIFANYLKYTNEAEHYKAFARPIKNLQATLSDQRYRTSVKKNMNEASLSQLDKYILDVSGTKTSGQLDTMDKIASLLRRHTGIVLIGANVLSGFRQLLSGFNATAEIGPYWMLRGIEEVMRNPGGAQKLIFSLSEQIEHRAGMWERFIAEERRAERYKVIVTGKMTPRKAFMAFASFNDRNTVLAAAMGTYLKVTSTGKLVDGTRIPNNDLERFAKLEVDRVSRKTQPYVSAKDLPGWHRGSTISLMFTLFQNMSNKVVNYVDYDIVGKLRYGTITPVTAAQRLLFAVILPALLLGMIARGRFPSIKEALLDVARFPLHGMFLIGSMVNTIVDDYGEWSTPVLLGPQALIETGKAIKRGEWVQAGKFGLQTTAYALGVPYNQPYRTYKGLRALMNDETDDWRRLIWSDYALTKR